MANFFRSIAAAGCLAALVGGCQTSGDESGKLDVVCTTGMIADLARNIGGDHVDVTAVMGPGVDPHLYTPSPGDVRQLQAADVIFYNGLHLEGRMAETLEKFGRKQPAFAVAEGIGEDRILRAEGDEADPHVWFDVSLWSEAAEVVCERLAEVDPEHAADYRANLEEYQEELAELHEFAKTELAKIPEKQRVLVTAHDAFRYFGRAYDIEVRGIQGISTDSEASIAQINELVRFLTDRKIKAVFVETSVPERQVRALIEGSRSAGHDLKIGGELYSDAMGEPGSGADTYAGMVRHNVTTIADALR